MIFAVLERRWLIQLKIKWLQFLSIIFKDARVIAVRSCHRP